MPIKEILKQKILVLDGAMGTIIQRYNLTEKDYRGERFTDYTIPLKGNNDLLVLTQPQIIYEIHSEYLKAGADIIETNTFNAQSVSMADYKMENLVYEINYNAAKIAKQACLGFAEIKKPRFVAGSIGPTNKSLSLPSDLNFPGKRNINFKQLVAAYAEQVWGLIDGGADLLLVETIFDTLNAKACLFAIDKVFTEKNISLPIMISVTISDNTGRTLSGQTLEAFVGSISHFTYLSLGLNCALGANQIKPYLKEIAKLSNSFVSVYPNAGLPDQSGNYKETAAEMTEIVKTFIDQGLVNIIGGCCGTTPEHIELFSEIANAGIPKKINKSKNELILAGTECLKINNNSLFINIGERTNVAGSKKFAKLIRGKKYDEALIIARKQIENGAIIIDISFDDGLLDAKYEIEFFLRLVACEPDIAKVPVMIDSSDFEVIQTGLQNIQGKAIVNSISLKKGEKQFKHEAEIIKKYGAAVVVMAFDENGQATDFQSKINICKRAYYILVNEVNFSPFDIVFDCNILTIGTGMNEHSNFAVDFINAVKWIKENLPYAKTSGGVSNLSYAFRGNNIIREALHTVFLYHAKNAGLDMAIVNPSNLPKFEDIDNDLKILCEDLIFNRHSKATENLTSFVVSDNQFVDNKNKAEKRSLLSVESRIKNALIKGHSDFINEDISDALKKYSNPVEIIEGPLMDAMNEIGEYFGEGKMFLPQVMKSARVLKKMTDIIQPAINKHEKTVMKKAGRILIATVKGDVHDIGKNIASVVLSSNNFEIIDLGIMVEKEKIIDEAILQNADIIGLSGLISPSLIEMENIAKELEIRNLSIPLIIGGATTSKTHTAVKIAPLYSGLIVHVKDVSKAVAICSDIINPENKVKFFEKIKSEQKKIREDFFAENNNLKKMDISEARINRFIWDKKSADIIKPKILNKIIKNSASISELIPFINWTSFFSQWKVKGKYPDILSEPDKGVEANKLYNDAKNMLDKISENNLLEAKALSGVFKASSLNETVFLNIENKTISFDFPRNILRNNTGKKNLCLSDFIAPSDCNTEDYLGLFVLTTGLGKNMIEDSFNKKSESYNAVMINVIADVLAEAYSELLHYKLRTQTWGYSNEKVAGIKDIIKNNYRGIKPASGYAICPDHSQKSIIFNILDAEKIGVKLSENYAIIPTSSICGFYFAHPEIKYFSINK